MSELIVPKVTLIDPDWTLRGPEDELFIQRQMDITPDFMDRIANTRFDKSKSREGEYMEVCEVPVIVVEKWLKEGFDIMKEPAKAILKRLRSENLDAFIATSKVI